MESVMMRISFTLSFLLASLVAKACGWMPESDHYYYHNLFPQTSISTKSFYPFLRDDSGTFFEDDGKPNVEANLALWMEMFDGQSLAELKELIYSSSDAEFEKFWSTKNKKHSVGNRKYLEFARKCSNAFSHRAAYSWEYDVIRNETEVDVSALLEEGNALFNQENHPQLKMRYGYQLVRILHYAAQDPEAIAFFHDQVEALLERNEIYYYALDQVAGCYYNLGNFEKAAQLFLKVFNHSNDRKKSAFLSYRFCTDRGAEGKTHFEGKEDEATFLLMRGLRSFSDGPAAIKDLYDLDPAGEKVELLFMREMNNLERALLPKHLGMGEGKLPMENPVPRDRAKRLSTLAGMIYTDGKVKNKDFWKLSESYLSFLNGEVELAKQQLKFVKGERYQAQVQTLAQVYEVFSWSKIGEREEAYLATLLDEVLTKEQPNDWGDYTPSFNKFILLDFAGHQYYKHGYFAKAFLMHNRIENVERVGSLALIQDLEAFTKKAEKSSFEKMLMRRANNQRNSGAEAYLQLVKGHYYLQQGQPDMALPLLKAAEVNPEISYFQSALNYEVSARIFSNNTMECFECPEEEVMVDLVYKADVFSFIKSSFSRSEMASYLLTLESLTSDEKLWKRKLAHYLLANYYFNVSNTGYYRGVLQAQASNCCHYHYFPYTPTNYINAADRIANKAGYNLSDINQHNKTYFNLASRSNTHYEQVLAASTDAELNARCLYMMAKCELNTYYNTALEPFYFRFYNGTVTKGAEKYKNSFAKLKKSYSHTKFYSMMIEECSFFRMYSSL